MDAVGSLSSGLDTRPMSWKHCPRKYNMPLDVPVVIRFPDDPPTSRDQRNTSITTSMIRLSLLSPKPITQRCARRRAS